MCADYIVVSGKEFLQFATDNPKIWNNLTGVEVQHYGYGNGQIITATPRENELYTDEILVKFYESKKIIKLNYIENFNELLITKNNNELFLRWKIDNQELVYDRKKKELKRLKQLDDEVQKKAYKDKREINELVVTIANQTGKGSSPTVQIKELLLAQNYEYQGVSRKCWSRIYPLANFGIMYYRMRYGQRMLMEWKSKFVMIKIWN